MVLFSASRDRLLDVLLPPRCGGCERIGELLCAACAASVRLPGPGVCLRCMAEMETIRSDCGCGRRLPNLRRLRSAGAYEGALERAVRRFKYGGRRALAKPLARLLADQEVIEGLPAAAIAWVPLHPRRRRARGYDQAELLAAELGHLCGLRLVAGLTRTRETPPQVGLDRPSRRLNVVGAFAWRGRRPPPGPVLLVDDVATTGATLDAAAQALRQAGSGPVYALTVARATL